MTENSDRRVKVGVGVFIVKDDCILVGRRINANGHGTWGLPGGHLEFGETPEECAQRETLEETSLIIKNIIPGPWINVIFNETNQHYLDLFLFAKYEGGTPTVLEPEKCSEWKWCRLTEIPDPKFKPLEILLNDGFNLEKFHSFFKGQN